MNGNLTEIIVGISERRKVEEEIQIKGKMMIQNIKLLVNTFTASGRDGYYIINTN